MTCLIVWLTTMFALGACLHLPRVQRTVEASAVGTKAGAECDHSRGLSPKMMIRASWMLGIEVEIAEEGRMWVLIVHSFGQVESCSFLAAALFHLHSLPCCSLLSVCVYSPTLPLPFPFLNLLFWFSLSVCHMLSIMTPLFFFSFFFSCLPFPFFFSSSSSSI